MSEPYIGEIRMVGFNFAPVGWSLCNGQTIAISQNEVLFNLIGTTYGGDGEQTFLLPNLQGRVAIHQGSSFVIGQVSGSENTVINSNQMPIHNHPARASTAASSPDPTGKYWSTDPNGNVAAYNTAPENGKNMAGSAVGNNAGGSIPHDNMQPYQVINFIISMFGVYPTQN